MRLIQDSLVDYSLKLIFTYCDITPTSKTMFLNLTPSYLLYKQDLSTFPWCMGTAPRVRYPMPRNNKVMHYICTADVQEINLYTLCGCITSAITIQGISRVLLPLLFEGQLCSIQTICVCVEGEGGGGGGPCPNCPFPKNEPCKLLGLFRKLLLQITLVTMTSKDCKLSGSAGGSGSPFRRLILTDPAKLWCWAVSPSGSEGSAVLKLHTIRAVSGYRIGDISWIC